MKRVFITASGTETGKTFVTALLVRQFRACGMAVRALKPVISGFSQASLSESDTKLLLDAMSMPVTAQNMDLVSPWRFAAPLAPSMAARLEGRSLDLPEVVAFCRQAGRGAEEFLLIEGVGGVMAPLNDTHTVRDWIKALEIPALLVGASYLGGISHTLTALEALRASDISVAGIVVSESAGSSVPLDDTVADIARFSHGVRVRALPRILDIGQAPDITYLVNPTSKDTG